eukprot:Colp12_sorted_trinity150504_noHs@15772
MSKIFVTLFKNDGILEATDAKPFIILDSWDIATARKLCHERLYGTQLASARLYTDLGVELDDVGYIPAKQSIVVSSGEPFKPISYSKRLPKEVPSSTSAFVETVLPDLYAANNQSEPFDIPMADMLGNVENYLSKANPAEFGDQISGWKNFLQASTLEMPAEEAPVPQYPQFNSIFDNMHFPSIDLPHNEIKNVREVYGSETSAQSQASSVSNKRKASGGSPPMDNFETDSSNEGDSPASRGTDKKNRAASHKASEQRSRMKLKESIQELVLSVPTLWGAKNPTKATIIKKATDYVNYSKKTNSTLQKENEQIKREIAGLQQDRQLMQRQLQVANIMTVEISDLNHQYIYCDHMWEIVMGYSRHEVVGRYVREVIGCHQCPLMQQKCEEIHRNLEAGEVWVGLMLGKRRNGTTFACEATVAPIKDRNGKTFQYLCTRRGFHILTNSERDALIDELSKGMTLSTSLSKIASNPATMQTLLSAPSALPMLEMGNQQLLSGVLGGVPSLQAIQSLSTPKGQ